MGGAMPADFQRNARHERNLAKLRRRANAWDRLSEEERAELDRYAEAKIDHRRRSTPAEPVDQPEPWAGSLRWTARKL